MTSQSLGETLRRVSDLPPRRVFAASVGLMEGGYFGVFKTIWEVNPDAFDFKTTFFVIGSAIILAATGYGVYRGIGEAKKE